MKLQNIFKFTFVMLVATQLVFAKDKAKPFSFERFEQAHDLMPANGKYKGQYAENEVARSIVFLNDSEKKQLKLNADQFVFANFRHNGKFYIATIEDVKVDSEGGPISMGAIVDRLLYSEKHWEAKTNPQLAEVEIHSELLFYFKNNKGIKLLIDQSTKQTVPQNTSLISGVMYSVESVKSKKVPDANFIPDAFTDNFAIVPRVVSLYERDLIHKGDVGRIVNTTPLSFDDTLSQIKQIQRPEDELLFAALATSNAQGRTLAYNFLKRNCGTGIFDLFDLNLRMNVNHGGKLNLDLLKSQMDSIAQKDMPSFIAAASAAASGKFPVPAELVGILSSPESFNKAWRPYLDQINSSPEPEHFLYELPMFIHPHLAARGLIR